MPNYFIELEDAVRSARNERVAAVKLAREYLNMMIKAAHTEAVDRAWSQYEAKINQIWEMHDATVRQAQGVFDGAGQDAAGVARQDSAMAASV